MDNLRADSLHWAIDHVLRFGDTDVFPVPFEYKAIKAFRRDIVNELSTIDLTNYRTRAFIRQLIPKPNVGFRAVTQLDPLDTIILNATAYEAAPQVESFRIPRDNHIACSYRLEPQPNGVLFATGYGWENYHQESRRQISLEHVTHVVCADIADFYNQLYHHRIENALESSGVTPWRSKNIENMLLSLTANTSRGLPIGPSFSAVLSEATLADVDSFMQRKGFTHTRYVDDFRIFARSKREALNALHDLTEYIHNTHRLSLQGSKTKILTKNEFTENELYDPSEAEKDAQRRMVADHISYISGYSQPFDELETIEIPDELDIETVSSVLLELYDEATTETLRAGLARHVLRRAMALRVRSLVEIVINNLENTLPVFPDVINYLIRVTNARNAALIGERLQRFISESDYRDLPLIKCWCLHAFTARPELCPQDIAFRFAESTHDQTIAGRYGALIAKSHRTINWVRERKETWANTPPPVQRAIVWASTILSTDERNAWLQAPENSGAPLLKWVSKFARTQP